MKPSRYRSSVLPQIESPNDIEPGQADVCVLHQCGDLQVSRHAT